MSQLIKKLLISLLMFPVFLMMWNPDYTKASEPMELFSESALLIDAKSGDILFQKDSDKEMYPASITKIVTGIIAIEEGDLDDIVTISKNAQDQEGSSVYLLEGEKVSLWKLVQGLMINSGNDAGTAIAEYYDGSEEKFADRMNKFVKQEIGVENTNFMNPHGLYDPNHVTTAEDMAKIAQYAMGNETFRNLVGTKQMEWIGEGWETTLFNHHRLLWDYEGTSGVKNGYVPESGHTLVTSAERDGMELIVVTLKASSKYYSYQDTMLLLDYGFENFQSLTIDKGEVVKDSAGEDYILAKDVSIAKQKGDNIDFAVNSDDQLVIKTGDREEIRENVIVESTKNEMNPLTSSESKNNNEVISGDKNEHLTSFITVGALFVSLLLFVIIAAWKQNRKRKKKEQQRFSDSITLAKRNNY